MRIPCQLVVTVTSMLALVSVLIARRGDIKACMVMGMILTM